MKKFVYIFLIITILFLNSCIENLFRGINQINNTNRIKGACVYGPAGMKACVNGTTKNDCIYNFKGKWHPNRRCNK